VLDLHIAAKDQFNPHCLLKKFFRLHVAYYYWAACSTVSHSLPHVERIALLCQAQAPPSYYTV